MSDEFLYESELNTMRERKAYLKAEKLLFSARTVTEFLAALIFLMKTPRYALPYITSDTSVEFRIIEDSQTENYRFNPEVMNKLKESNQQFMIDFLLDTVMKKGVTLIRFDEGRLAFEFKQVVERKGEEWRYNICLTASLSKVLNLRTKKKKSK